jgi:hypothetical protein
MTNPANVEEIERAYFERWAQNMFPNFESKRFNVLAIHHRAGEYEYIEYELMWRAWLARSAEKRHG